MRTLARCALLVRADAPVLKVGERLWGLAEPCCIEPGRSGEGPHGPRGISGGGGGGRRTAGAVLTVPAERSFTASGKPTPRERRTKSTTSPPAPHPKHHQRSLSEYTVKLPSDSL